MPTGLRASPRRRTAGACEGKLERLTGEHMRVAGIVLASIAVVFATASCGATIVPVRNSAPGAPVVASSGASLRDGGELWRNDIPPRYQWNHNYGYCGEVSMISAGLYYGQYISQYDARAAASNAPQNEYRSQLLLGVNDLRAAERMRLAAVRWDVPSRKDSKQFLAWVKVHVLRGEPVAIGIYMNQFRFYGNRNPWAGSPQYDHIVPVVGMGGDDITFSDNGEWGSLRDNHKDATLRVWPISGHFPTDPVRVVDVYQYWIDYIADRFGR